MSLLRLVWGSSCGRSKNKALSCPGKDMLYGLRARAKNSRLWKPPREPTTFEVSMARAVTQLEGTSGELWACDENACIHMPADDEPEQLQSFYLL